MSFSGRESENIPKKGGMFGFRKRNKIKKPKNIPQLIAHILNIPNDKIVVLEKGTVVEEGSHEELLAKRGFYKDMYDSQLEKEK